MRELKTAQHNEVLKFEKIGDCIKGEYVGIEQSQKFNDGYGLTMIVDKKPIIVFVNRMVKELIESNAITKGGYIEVEYVEDVKTQDGKNTYRKYEVRYE